MTRRPASATTVNAHRLSVNALVPHSWIKSSSMKEILQGAVKPNDAHVEASYWIHGLPEVKLASAMYRS